MSPSPLSLRWLLHDSQMKLRSTYPGYLQAVERYFTAILSILVPLQSSHGGPIIAFQLENELAEYTQEVEESRNYLLFLYKVGSTTLPPSLPPSLPP